MKCSKLDTFFHINTFLLSAWISCYCVDHSCINVLGNLSLSLSFTLFLYLSIYRYLCIFIQPSVDYFNVLPSMKYNFTVVKLSNLQ